MHVHEGVDVFEHKTTKIKQQLKEELRNTTKNVCVLCNICNMCLCFLRISKKVC